MVSFFPPLGQSNYRDKELVIPFKLKSSFFLYIDKHFKKVFIMVHRLHLKEDKHVTEKVCCKKVSRDTYFDFKKIFHA